MSTPISQIAGGGQPGQHQFVNDAQRQMITSAQAAVQNYQMPQLSENAMLHEDDALVNDVLSQYNHGNDPSPTVIQAPAPQYQAPQPPQIAPQPMLANPSQGMYYPDDSYDPANVMKEMMQDAASASPVAFIFERDFKLAVIAAVACLILSAFPVDSWVYKYVPAIHKIPYAFALVRAVLTGIAVFLVAKLFLIRN